MKNFIVAALLSTAFASSAFAKTIASYSFDRSNTNALVSGMDIVTVELQDTREIRVTERIYNGYDSSSLVSTVVTIDELSDEVFEEFRDSLAALSDAEVETRYSRIVCMMMPVPGADQDLQVATGYNYETRLFAGKLRLVLSRGGCWLSSHTFPKADYLRDDARSLALLLKIVALQAITK